MGNHKWSLLDMPDQTGRVVVITGGNSGLGFETAKAFALRNAEVVIACRSIEKGEIAKESIISLFPNGKVNVIPLDLVDLSSVEAFASHFMQNYARLDILINNAGIMTCPYALTKDGFESQMGTNHLGHFALTGHLIRLISSTPNSRVVVVSSLAHKQWKISFENSLSEYAPSYNRMRAYARSKLANLLFAYHLQRMLEQKNVDSICVAAHPGASYTNLGRHLEGSLFVRFLRPLIVKILPTAASGALPIIRAAVDIEVKGGAFYGPSGFLQLSGSPVRVESSRTSHNSEDSVKLWGISERLTGVRFW